MRMANDGEDGNGLQFTNLKTRGSRFEFFWVVSSRSEGRPVYQSIGSLLTGNNCKCAALFVCFYTRDASTSFPGSLFFPPNAIEQKKRDPGNEVGDAYSVWTNLGTISGASARRITRQGTNEGLYASDSSSRLYT